MGNKSLILGRIVKSLFLLSLIILLLITLTPFFMVTNNAFKSETEYYAEGPVAIAQSLNLDTIKAVWYKMDYLAKLKNGLFISITTALLAILLSFFNAFALGIGNIKGKLFFIAFFLLSWMLPQEAIVYPLYYLFKLVGLYGTRLSVILILSVIYSAFGTYLLSSVFSTFEKGLLEAAKIDGCNKIQLMFRIVMPLSLPTLSVLFVFFFIWSYNEFLLPLIFLTSNKNQTVVLAIALTRGKYGESVTTQSAVALLGIVPCIIFFILFQRNLTKGLIAGSIKK